MLFSWWINWKSNLFSLKVLINLKRKEKVIFEPNDSTILKNCKKEIKNYFDVIYKYEYNKEID